MTPDRLESHRRAFESPRRRRQAPPDAVATVRFRQLARHRRHATRQELISVTHRTVKRIRHATVPVLLRPHLCAVPAGDVGNAALMPVAGAHDAGASAPVCRKLIERVPVIDQMIDQHESMGSCDSPPCNPLLPAILVAALVLRPFRKERLEPPEPSDDLSGCALNHRTRVSHRASGGSQRRRGHPWHCEQPDAGSPRSREGRDPGALSRSSTLCLVMGTDGRSDAGTSPGPRRRRHESTPRRATAWSPTLSCARPGPRARAIIQTAAIDRDPTQGELASRRSLTAERPVGSRHKPTRPDPWRGLRGA
jgi:hypothetical protein